VLDPAWLAEGRDIFRGIVIDAKDNFRRSHLQTRELQRPPSQSDHFASVSSTQCGQGSGRRPLAYEPVSAQKSLLTGNFAVLGHLASIRRQKALCFWRNSLKKLTGKEF
jgi:hypothetical protein